MVSILARSSVFLFSVRTGPTPKDLKFLISSFFTLPLPSLFSLTFYSSYSFLLLLLLIVGQRGLVVGVGVDGCTSLCLSLCLCLCLVSRHTNPHSLGLCILNLNSRDLRFKREEKSWIYYGVPSQESGIEGTDMREEDTRVGQGPEIRFLRIKNTRRCWRAESRSEYVNARWLTYYS